MPNRIVREGWIRSRRVAATSAWPLLLWQALKSVADDYGRFSAEPALVRSACFPRRLGEITDANVATWLEELAATRLIGIYQAGADMLLQIYKFEQRVRAKSKYPAPPLTLLDALEEPEDSVARLDAGYQAGPQATRPSGVDDRHMTVIPRADGAQAADKCARSAAVVVVGGVCGDGGGGGARADLPPPHPPGLQAVPKTGPMLVRPPEVPRPPEYVASCSDCAEMLRTLNDLTCRTYTAAGRGGELLHRAHEVVGLEKAIATIRQEVERTGRRPGKARFLAPQFLFEAANWDGAVNATEGGMHDPDALRPLRV